MSQISHKSTNRILCMAVAAAALCLGPITTSAASKHLDTRSADAKSADTKAPDPKSGDTKSANTKPGDVPHAVAERISVPGVSNFGEVTPTLFRGAQPTERGFENLSKMGVAIVVDLREGGEVEREQKEVTALGMKFVAISWNCRDPKDAYFSKFLTLLRENPGKKVFVHCHSGVDRTGMMIAAYRMDEQGWTADESLGEMKTFGLSMFHRMICSPIESYEAKFPSIMSGNAEFQVAQKADATAPVSATQKTSATAPASASVATATPATAVPPKQ
jgi:tyrosine-protein phosphatase SIW14